METIGSIQGLGLKITGCWFRVQELGCRVKDVLTTATSVAEPLNRITTLTQASLSENSSLRKAAQARHEAPTPWD